MSMHKQVSNVRTAIPGHMHFATEDGERAYLERVERARAAQSVPYAVAPEQQVKTKRGTFLKPGDEVTLGDVDEVRDEHGRVLATAVVQLDRLVRAGFVLERY